jgi:hypothetical protein
VGVVFRLDNQQIFLQIHAENSATDSRGGHPEEVSETVGGVAVSMGAWELGG